MSRLKTSERYRIRIRIRGNVQGVGFRPFVYRLATELDLSGWVRNVSGGVDLEVEGAAEARVQLMRRLKLEAPPPAEVRSLDADAVGPSGQQGFEIQDSLGLRSDAPTEVLADMATCDACLRELFDPADRRYRYPFTNCTHCGPRYTIIREMPYDRCRTSFAEFAMCDACRAEYQDPLDRRFHAQPISCPDCGPRLEWSELGTDSAAVDGAALESAVEAIAAGSIVAVKGLGGFHLLADATNEETIRVLRERKGREAKPFAVMLGSLKGIAEECHVSALESKLLQSRAAPIVLLRRNEGDSEVTPLIAPENPYLGVLLPYTPLHHLLVHAVGRPLVATSGNRVDEPICYENETAKRRLENVADGILMHDYAIQRAVDDSVVCVVAGREMALRRSRGYVPMSLNVGVELASVMGLGGDLKNTLAVTSGRRAFMSPHLGDVSNASALESLKVQRDELPRLLGLRPVAVASDAHPGYFSARIGSTQQEGTIAVQHHHAHVAACLADNEVDEEVLGVVWDGAGYGTDGSVWGGEFLMATLSDFRRFAFLRPFALLGGDQAARRPSLVALGLMFELGVDPPASLLEEFSPRELSVYQVMFTKGINCPRTSSMGRLFDGVAALVGLSRWNRFEGESAMKMEFALPTAPIDESYAVPQGQPLDWGELIIQILDDVEKGTSREAMSARFHNAMVRLILAVAQDANRAHVALTGGCFQNRYLLERAVAGLRAMGFNPLWHRRVPTNDGGLSLGQACVVGRQRITV